MSPPDCGPHHIKLSHKCRHSSMLHIFAVPNPTSLDLSTAHEPQKSLSSMACLQSCTNVCGLAHGCKPHCPIPMPLAHHLQPAQRWATNCMTYLQPPWAICYALVGRMPVTAVPAGQMMTCISSIQTFIPCSWCSSHLCWLSTAQQGMDVLCKGCSNHLWAPEAWWVPWKGQGDASPWAQPVDVRQEKGFSSLRGRWGSYLRLRLVQWLCLMDTL